MPNDDFMLDLKRVRLEVENRIYYLKKAKKTRRASVYHEGLNAIDLIISQIKKHGE